MEAIHRSYEDNYLSTSPRHGHGGANVPGQWSLRYLAFILSTYVVCTLPWLLNEMAMFYVDTGPLARSLSLLVYPLNFYITSGVCLFMTFKDCTSSRKGRSYALEQNYRLRNIIQSVWSAGNYLEWPFYISCFFTVKVGMWHIMSNNMYSIYKKM